MGRVIIVSNRLPLQIKIEDDKLDIKPSVGGLATGMQSVHNNYESKWIGWSGLAEDEIPHELKVKVAKAIKAEDCGQVALTSSEIEDFYYGFSNKTIWPLFHYFTEYTEYNRKEWDSYVKVNEKFAAVVVKELKEGDTVWIHDYQLLLLPKLIKDIRPDVSIGFFLHIPFPSYEVFRILPWRTEILTGMLGADLLGFHTYDYERHFFSSVRRLLGYDINFNIISMEDRQVKADSFPMGIDFDKFQDAAIQQQQKSIKDKSEVQQALDKHILNSPDTKLILSIDRLDYTKGIAARLKAFEYFLEKNPEYLGKAILVMLAVPSRSNVEQYQIMKSEVDELVGRINGEFGTIDWTPVWYFYRSMPFENLIDLYSSCDVALLTPIRDGMNLVAKEYIASRTDKKGVLILSEMAGAAKEMSESLVINPNNFEEISQALIQAISMSDEEQVARNTVLQERLKRYNIHKWSTDFMNSLEDVKHLSAQTNVKHLTEKDLSIITEDYAKSGKRALFLDYDGTLVGFKNNPLDAKPDAELYNILDTLSKNPKNHLILISGRDKDTFDKWFKDKNYSMIVEHGVWRKDPETEWQMIEPMNVDWKDTIRPIFEFYSDRTPGSFIEEKNFSLVWHFRKADPELGVIRANELKDELNSMIANHDLEILEGKKVIELKNSGVNKGKSALKFIGEQEFDFIYGMGDDWTDEYLFAELPESAYTVKVGMAKTSAKFKVESFTAARGVLKKLCEK